MALDQAHEQMNALIKGDGGAVGITDNPSALKRWMIAGPEVSRLIQDFEKEADSNESQHHESGKSYQRRFAREVQDLVAAMNELGNPFQEDSNDLLTLDTKNIMDTDVKESVMKAYQVGKKQFQEFTKERLLNRSKPLTDPIKKNKFPLLTVKKKPAPSKKAMTALKEDCNLFSRLYIACQSRTGDLEQFFKHENQPWPPALAKLGDMRSGNKADLLAQLEAISESTAAVPNVTALILDGAVIVQMLSPTSVPCNTFQDYVDSIFMPYISQQLASVNRLDLVWDRYLADSLKASTRERRGDGLRRRVNLSSKVPPNWQSFLRVNENKTELFQLLGREATTLRMESKEVCSTYGDKVIAPSREDMSTLSPCQHEEADTRIVLHVSDAAQCGHRRIMVRTSDTDVVVLLISSFHSMPAEEIWVSFGSGKHHRYIAVHGIAAGLGVQKSKALAVFHAFTGCDVTSFFAGKGKKSAWDTWSIFPDATDAFLALADRPMIVPRNVVELIERFVVLMYDKQSELYSVNDARQHLFSRKCRSIENIPPTQAALEQHIHRAAYQGGHVWGQVLQREPVLPDPAEWGWEKEENSSKWVPRWSTLGQAYQNCYELLHCNCRKACRGLCKCYKAALKCTALCLCEGGCWQD